MTVSVPILVDQHPDSFILDPEPAPRLRDAQTVVAADEAVTRDRVEQGLALLAVRRLDGEARRQADQLVLHVLEAGERGEVDGNEAWILLRVVRKWAEGRVIREPFGLSSEISGPSASGRPTRRRRLQSETGQIKLL